MRRSLLASGFIVVLALALGACGSSGSNAASTPPTSAWVPAGPNPSASAKMVCAKEAQTDIDASLGAKVVSVSTPTWADHVYSCTYKYATGSFTLSVKEMSTTPETTAYFNAQGKKLGRRPGAVAIGQGGFQTTNGSVVIRKDWKVLTVDVTKLPASFGQPPETAAQVATSVAATILGCWTGS